MPGYASTRFNLIARTKYTPTIEYCNAKANATYLITHAGDNWTVPVSCETCYRFQGEGAGRSDECDHVVPEMHVRC